MLLACSWAVKNSSVSSAVHDILSLSKFPATTQRDVPSAASSPEVRRQNRCSDCQSSTVCNLQCGADRKLSADDCSREWTINTCAVRWLHGRALIATCLSLSDHRRQRSLVVYSLMGYKDHLLGLLQTSAGVSRSHIPIGRHSLPQFLCDSRSMNFDEFYTFIHAAQLPLFGFAPRVRDPIATTRAGFRSRGLRHFSSNYI